MAAPPSAFRRVVGNSFYLLLAEAGARILTFLAIVHLAPTLGRVGQGAFDFSLTVFGLLGLLATGGVEIRAIRMASSRRRNLGRIAGATLLVSWIYFAGGFLLFLAVAGSLPPGLRRVSLLLAPAAALLPLGMRFAFLGREAMGILPVARILGGGTFLVLCVVGVRAPEHLVRAPLFWMAAALVESSVQFAAFRRRFGSVRLRIRLSRLRLWLRATFSLSLARTARNLMLLLDLLVLGFLVPEAALGEYSIANRIPMLLVMTAFLAQTPVYPVVARALAAGERGRLAAVHGDTVRAALGTSVPVALAIALAAEPLLVLLFTEEYLGSVLALRILVWRFPLVAIGGLFRNIVWATRPERDVRVTTGGLLCALAAVAAGAFLAGIEGAAWGILAGESCLLVGYAREARESLAVWGLGDDAWWGRGTVAILLVLAGSLLARSLPPVAAVSLVASSAAAAVSISNWPYALRLWHEWRRGTVPSGEAGIEGAAAAEKPVRKEREG